MNTYGVIFDMDGVIFNTEEVWRDGYNVANKIFGFDVDENYRKTLCGKSEEDIRKELYKKYPDKDVDAYRDYVAKYVNLKIETGEFQIKPYFIEIISYLKEKGYKTMLATSNTMQRAEKMFMKKGLEIHDFFDSYVFADEVDGKSKPDPYIFHLAATKLGFKAENCYVIEDSMNGIEAAVKGGFKAIMDVDLIEPNDYAKKHCINIIYNLEELKNIL